MPHWKQFQYSISNSYKDAPNTQIHDRSLSWLGTDTSVKSGGFKLVFRLNSLKKTKLVLDKGICRATSGVFNLKC